MLKKSLFIANLSSEMASGRQRLWALEQCGFEVFTINFDDYSSKFGKLGEITARIMKQPNGYKDISKLEDDIENLSSRIQPSLIWFEWPKFFKGTFLKKLRTLFPKAYFVCFQDDNPWGERNGDFWRWKNYLKIVPFFDLHIIKRQSDEENLKKLGAKRCYIWLHGIYSPIFYPIPQAEIKYPISFIGTCMDNRVEIIEYLLSNQIPIHIFGYHWAKRSTLPKRFPDFFHNAVQGKDYGDVIRSSQICLGLVSHSNHDEWTMRTFEVPGCARLLLAERTNFHQNNFFEGKEIELFSTKDECLSKIRFLINDKLMCEKIGQNSYKKMSANNWLIEKQMLSLVNFINLW